MSDSEEIIQDIIESIESQIEQIAESVEKAENLETQKVEGSENLEEEEIPVQEVVVSEVVETENSDNLEGSDNLEEAKQEAPQEVNIPEVVETENSDNLEKSENMETQKVDETQFEAEEIYNTTTPISNAILHRMYKITILNENLKEYYMNNLIRSMIRDVIGHARRRLQTIRYTSLGITKQEDDIFKAKGLYKEKEFMTIKQALQTKFPSANIKITKQTPLSENHIPVTFEISWEALELGEEIEEETPTIKQVVVEPLPEKVPEIKQVSEPVKAQEHVAEAPSPPVPVLTQEEQETLRIKREKELENQKKKQETQLNKDMNADYAIQKFLMRKRRI